MSYDPYRTNMLPPVGPQFPITEEIPAVRGRGPGGSSRFGLKMIAALLLATILGIAGILLIDSQRTDQADVGDPEASPTEGPESATPVAEPTPVALEPDEAGYWQVVGVADGLNVRSGPGTTNDVVGALAAGTRHVRGTGERAEVNGGEWREIEIGGTVGWVSARFLATDTAPDEAEPTPALVASTSVVCFEAAGPPARLARLVFTDRTRISGTIRTINAQSTVDRSVEGTLSDGQARVTLTETDGSSVTQTWTFNPASVELGPATELRVVDCNTLPDLG